MIFIKLWPNSSNLKFLKKIFIVEYYYIEQNSSGISLNNRSVFEESIERILSFNY